ncbi:uncharacterized protein LOC105779082 [Gossypium raimondii]|uniref:uncharacterized protein LOC105779082 n=1 Tax=Gossypium raimondii TaxID=29730 RepID=UPI00063ABCD3|nr:uncharacterized protein LOC105779082 [Gossypium raimondii]
MRKEKSDDVNAEILETFRKVQVNIPLIDAIKQVPRYAKFLKELCTYKIKLIGNERIGLGENVSAVFQKKLPLKYKDHGMFSIPCKIGGLKIDSVMLNLGASINVMPRSIYDKVHLGSLKETGLIIQLADRSNAYPDGILEDVLVQVNELVFQVDFYVLDMGPNISSSDVPLLLGRPFLKTSRTKIDVHRGNLTMEFDGEIIKFNIYDAMRYPTDINSVYALDVIDNLVQNVYKLGEDDELESVLTKSIFDADMNNHEFVVSNFLIDSVCVLNSPQLTYSKLIFPSIEVTDKQIPSLISPPKLELKGLPENLKYIYLGENQTLPLIVSNALTEIQESKLIRVLREHREAFGWTLANIRGLSTTLCTHKIALEPNSAPKRDLQRRLNPPMMEVVKKEILKWLEANVIYLIADSEWVPIAPEDQEKTTFTCPFGTYAFKRMPFGLCNAPATFQRGKDVTFEFNENCKKSFDELKLKLITTLIIQGPNYALPFEILCDASDRAVGVALGQRNGRESYVIRYASELLNPAQCNYTTTEKELYAIVFALEKFRAYLLRVKVIVFSNHSALKYLLHKKEAKPRLIRWIFLLQEFDLEIKYKKGKENFVVDHLGRIKTGDVRSEPSDLFPDERLYSVSSALPWYADMVNYLVTKEFPTNAPRHLRKKITSQSRFYLWHEPYLWRFCSDQTIRRCVDDSEIEFVLNFCHSQEGRGHFGPKKTTYKILECGLFWLTIHKDSYAFCKNCASCQRIGNLSSRNQIPLHNFYVCDIFDVWGIDFIGPFPSSFGYLYILVCVDYLLKWVEAFPTRIDDAKTIVKLLKANILNRYGVPRAIISDKGTHFCN